MSDTAASSSVRLPPKIVVVGSVNADIILDVAVLPRPNETIAGRGLKTVIGGKGLNQAIALARLGCDTHMIAAVGDDAFGEQARDYLRDNVVGQQHVTTIPETPTGTAHILVAADGQNMITVCSGANGHLTPEMVEAASDLIRKADALVVQLETPLAAVRKALEIARAHGVRTLLNPAPAQLEALDLFGLADIVTPNETELAAFTGIEGLGDATLHAALHALIRAGAGQVVATLGIHGCVTLIDGSLVCLPAFKVKAVDTTGAGDVFTAGLTSELARGRKLLDALRFASAASAISVSRQSANSAPTRQEVEAFLRDTV